MRGPILAVFLGVVGVPLLTVLPSPRTFFPLERYSRNPWDKTGEIRGEVTALSPETDRISLKTYMRPGDEDFVRNNFYVARGAKVVRQCDPAGLTDFAVGDDVMVRYAVQYSGRKIAYTVVGESDACQPKTWDPFEYERDY